jgi:hypothetical protein
MTPTEAPTADLIARLVEAKTGSFVLDGEIWKVVCPKRFENLLRPPAYTVSLDAALTLVPEGFAVACLGIWPGERASLKILGTHKAPDGRYWHEHTDGIWEAEGATAPLAVCVGALKAREITMDERPMEKLAEEARQLSALPTKVTQIARGDLFEDLAAALEALWALYKADMEYDRCHAALLSAQAANAARGNQTNPAKEQRDATKAAINRKIAMRGIKWTA